MSKREERVLSLDGLRGLGALQVFLLHIDIMVKPFDEGGVPSLFPGVASVMVFFILSGIVLSLVPFKHLNDGDFDWLGYYPRRIVRLCIPPVRRNRPGPSRRLCSPAHRFNVAFRVRRCRHIRSGVRLALVGLFSAVPVPDVLARRDHRQAF